MTWTTTIGAVMKILFIQSVLIGIAYIFEYTYPPEIALGLKLIAFGCIEFMLLRHLEEKYEIIKI